MTEWMLFSLAAGPWFIAAVIFAVKSDRWRHEADRQRRRADALERLKNL